MSKQSINSKREDILRISTGGVCLALAFVLSQLKLFEMPMGGTVTPASTLPIIVYGVAFGHKNTSVKWISDPFRSHHYRRPK